MRHSLLIAIPALALCAPACAPVENENRSVAVGNADTVYCRTAQAMPGSRLGPVCRTASDWTHYPTYGRTHVWPDPAIVPNAGIEPTGVGCNPVCM
jgi:hypothetical protein